MSAFSSRFELVRTFILLDVKARYRSSYLGLLWSLLQPMVMLATYAFLFGVVVQPRWSFGQGERTLPYPVVLFCGIMLFNVLGETLSRAPSLLASHSNYVKKAVFPLEILPAVVVGSALAQFAVNLAILLAGLAVLGELPGAGLLWLPLVLLPLALLSLGLSWLAAAAGVFFRDLAHAMPFALQALFFLTPVLYPLEALPSGLGSALKLNVVGAIVTAGRGAVLFGQTPDWASWAGALLAGAAACAAGYALFMRCRPEFADAL